MPILVIGLYLRCGYGLVTGTKLGTHTCSVYICGIWAGREGWGEGYTSNGTTCMMVCIVLLLLCPLRAGMGCMRVLPLLCMEESEDGGMWGCCWWCCNVGVVVMVITWGVWGWGIDIGIIVVIGMREMEGGRGTVRVCCCCCCCIVGVHCQLLPEVWGQGVGVIVIIIVMMLLSLLCHQGAPPVVTWGVWRWGVGIGIVVRIMETEGGRGRQWGCVVVGMCHKLLPEVWGQGVSIVIIVVIRMREMEEGRQREMARACCHCCIIGVHRHHCHNVEEDEGEGGRGGVLFLFSVLKSGLVRFFDLKMRQPDPNQS